MTAFATAKRLLTGLCTFVLAVLVVGGTPRHGYADSYALVKPVEIELVNSQGAGVRMSVPSAYMKRSVDRRGGRLHDFILDAVYPEMMPLFMSDPDSFGGDHDVATLPDAEKRFWIRIWIHEGVPDLISRLMRERLGRPRLADGDVDENEREFVVFRVPGLKDILVPKDRIDEQTIYFSCWPIPEPKGDVRLGAGCYGRVLVGDRLHAEFIFQRRHVRLWKDVEARVRSLVRLFMIDCFHVEEGVDGDYSAPTSDCIP